MDYRSRSFLLGFLGDGALQLVVANYPPAKDWGLSDYFARHGKLESMLIAGGLTYGVAAAYVYAMGEPDLRRDWWKLFATGALGDLAIDKLDLLPTIRPFYDRFSVPFTMGLGGLIMLVPAVKK